MRLYYKFLFFFSYTRDVCPIITCIIKFCGEQIYDSSGIIRDKYMYIITSRGTMNYRCVPVYIYIYISGVWEIKMKPTFSRVLRARFDPNASA